MFGWKKKAAPHAVPLAAEPVALARLGDDNPLWREAGPRDLSEVDTSFGYIDHGCVRVPRIEGLRIAPLGSLTDGKAAGIRIGLGTSLIEVEVYAAPRSGEVWTEVRHSLRELAQSMGASVTSSTGRYGVEQQISIPVDLPDGGKGQTLVREIGHEGPRWMSRIKILGEAVTDPHSRHRCEMVVDRLVIVRGTEPRARLELLPATFESESVYTVGE